MTYSDLPPSQPYERRAAWFLALAEKYRRLAAAALDEKLRGGYSKLADGFESLAKSCSKLAQQAG
jgi:hypothetical protein